MKRKQGSKDEMTEEMYIVERVLAKRVQDDQVKHELNELK